MLRRRFKIILNRCKAEALGFEQTFQMLPGVDYSPCAQHPVCIDQSGKRQPAHLIGNAERGRNDVRKYPEPMSQYELSLAGDFAVAGQNDIHTVKEWIDLKEFDNGCKMALTLATME